MPTDRDKPKDEAQRLDQKNSHPASRHQNAFHTESTISDGPLENSTQRVDDGDNEKVKTALIDAPDSDPTDLLETIEDSEWGSPDAGVEEIDENVLKPSRLRWVLVFALFVFIAAWSVLDVFDQFSQTSAPPDMSLEWVGHHLIVSGAGPDLADKVFAGDEIVSVNDEQIDARYKYRQIFRQMDPDQTYSLRILRSGKTIDLELPVVRPPIETELNIILLAIITPAAFFITGLLVFLFHPNNKLTLLIAVAFALTTNATTPYYDLMYPVDPLPLYLLWESGYLISLIGTPVLLHMFLLFPTPSRIVRRYPRLQLWIYLPFILYVLPVEMAQKLAFDGVTAFQPALEFQALSYTDFIYPPYLLAGLLVLAANYRDAGRASRLRMRFLIVGVSIAIIPFIFIEIVLPPIEGLLNVHVFTSAGWRFLIENVPIIIAPPVFAYAVIRHRVIPISFIIRRGLQYLFARNGVRLLILLPIAGMIWNVLADPDKKLNDLIFHNSTGFYILFALAIAGTLVSRLRLNEWIDKRFFRDQYDQERILSGLIENIKESDSMTKLSRLVSSQIHAAMHPSSIHFFYEETQKGGFSLGYTTSERSANMRLGPDSALLQFMERQNAPVDVPSALTDELGKSENAWLRKIGAALLVPMHGRDGKLTGFFSLGDKLSEVRYTSRDKNILATLANQIALVHENISLKERMRVDQRVRDEVLARFEESDIDLLKECAQCGRCYGRADEVCEDDGQTLAFSLPVGRTINDRYRLENLLGKGGMGSVYAATDLRMNRRVALKVLNGGLFGNSDAQRRFEREARSAGKLNHRNIVTIFDFGSLATEGLFLTMEFVEGQTLLNVLRRSNKLPAETVIDWSSQLLDGIDAAHQTGIIHRDLKPDNIYVTNEPDGSVRIRILDFGLARFKESEVTASVTVPGTIMGTFGYMSPEQLHGEKTDERCDLFSVAVIMFECLYGNRPFAGSSYRDLVESMSRPVIVESGDLFSQFLQRGLAIEPGMRFASAREMKSALLNIPIS